MASAEVADVSAEPTKDQKGKEEQKEPELTKEQEEQKGKEEQKEPELTKEQELKKKWGRNPPPPTAPKPFYKFFTIKLQTTIKKTLKFYIGADLDTNIATLRKWAYYNAFSDEISSIYKIGIFFDGIELTDTTTLGQIGFDNKHVRLRNIMVDPKAHRIIESQEHMGAAAPIDGPDGKDGVKMHGDIDPSKMTDADRRAAALRFFWDKCKPKFDEVDDITSEDLLELFKDGKAPRRAEVLFIDCRSDPEMQVSMLPGAISQKEWDKSYMPVIDGKRKAPKHVIVPGRIITYCGNSMRSGKYASKMQALLKPKGIGVYNHVGSVCDWCHVSGPLVLCKKEGKGKKLFRGTGKATKTIHACTKRFLVNFPVDNGYNALVPKPP